MTDAGASPRLDAQVGVLAASDAATASDAPPRSSFDARAALLSDGAVEPCDFSSDAGGARCTGFLCSAEGGVYAALEQSQPWNVGALDWTASMCRRALGWSAAMSSDLRYILYGITERDRYELEAGIPLFVYWSDRLDPPASGARPCNIAPAVEPLPACPATSYPPQHVSLRGCRSPTQPGCEVCTNFSSNRPSYRGAWPGSDSYDAVFPFTPAPCAPHCPSCASCTLRDEQRLTTERRRECEPCPAKLGIDPCFGGDTCECYCSQYSYLASICPTFAQ